MRSRERPAVSRTDSSYEDVQSWEWMLNINRLDAHTVAEFESSKINEGTESFCIHHNSESVLED